MTTAPPNSLTPALAGNSAKQALQLAKHLVVLYGAARRLGLSPEVTGPLNLAAKTATAEAAQMACPHARKSTTDMTSRNLRVRFTVCMDCHKFTGTEDI